MLKRGEILVWTMRVCAVSAATVANWRLCLDQTERARSDRFVFEADRTTYIAAHWLVRNALARAGGLPPACWRFVKEANGKPQIDPMLNPSGLQFNLSHSRGLVGCAITAEAAIGFDVEAISPGLRELEFAERCFSPAEIAALYATPPNQRRRTFYRFWTLKEALIKATGEGLRRPLDSFSFSLDPTTVAFHPENQAEAEKWTFVERRPTSDHMLAIATRRPPAEPLRLISLACDPAASMGETGSLPRDVDRRNAEMPAVLGLQHSRQSQQQILAPECRYELDADRQSRSA
jgi:4'-phosphopantetheinyl transferase